jgi:hypothetical protein
MLLASFVIMSEILGKVKDFREDFPYFCKFSRKFENDIFFSTLAAIQ